MDNKLFLIDGHSLIFKMYYAFLRRPMINSKGDDMSILFGFTKYLFELVEKEKPSHLAMFFDPPGGTFRKRLYPEYKANRTATPQLVIDALDPLTEICHALNIPVLMVDDFEADDVIGTVAGKTAGKDMTVYMVTPDKDYSQLVTDNILQYKPGKAGGEKEIMGPADVCAKYGITAPTQVVDILTLCGDASDNVPGVKGVGEVGAGKLISKYGSVPAIYEHLDELSPKQKQAFEDARSYISLSRELVTIRRDVPVEVDVKAMEWDDRFSPEIVGLFDKYEFGSLKKYIGHVEGAPAAKVEKPEIVYNQVGAVEIVRLASGAGCCSIITEGADETIFAPVRKVWIGVAASGGCAVCGGSMEDFRALIEDETVAKTGYNLKKQRNILHNSGVELRGRLLDIELMHYLIDPEKSHKLEILAKSLLGVDVQEHEDAGKPEQTLSLFDEPEADDAQEDAALSREVAITALLGGKVAAQMAEAGQTRLYDEIEEPLLKVLSDMECEGVRVDLNQLKQFAAGLSAQLDQIRQNIRDMAGEPNLNVMSTKQIGAVLFEKLALDPKVKKASSDKRYSYSTDEETLTALADRHPIINEILEYRGIQKLLSTYIDPFPNYVSPRTGKIHTTFNQALTATGRLSSSKPNLQNIPVRTERGKEIRKAFVPSHEGGTILSADYSQIELRIMAHLSGDEHLIQAFREGKDVHSITAARIFGISPEEVTPDQRRTAKTANFGIIYGISTFGLAQRLKISRAEAKKIIDGYYANFPSVSLYIQNAVARARENGYVETLFGRRRYLPDINAKNANARAFAERNAVNAPIQGTAADIIKLAMIGVARRLASAGLKSKMVLQVHDELVFDALLDEVEQLRKIVVEEMEHVIELSIPLTVDCNYGNNWLEAH